MRFCGLTLDIEQRWAESVLVNLAQHSLFMYAYLITTLVVLGVPIKTPIGGQKCYKIFEVSNTLYSPTVGGTKKIN